MNDKIVEFLKENRIKVTNERTSIIGILRKTNLPLTPAEIYLQVKTQLPKANLTTVYRNLEMLEDLRLLKRLAFNQTGFSYELLTNRPHHHHAVCKKCGRVEDLENISEKFVDKISQQTNFKIEDHNLEFFGLCENCQKDSG